MCDVTPLTVLSNHVIQQQQQQQVSLGAADTLAPQAARPARSHNVLLPQAVQCCTSTICSHVHKLAKLAAHFLRVHDLVPPANLKHVLEEVSILQGRTGQTARSVASRCTLPVVPMARSKQKGLSTQITVLATGNLGARDQWTRPAKNQVLSVG